MRKLAFLTASTVFAVLPLTLCASPWYASDFETTEGFSAGALADPSPWIVSGSASILDTGAVQGSQSLQVLPSGSGIEATLPLSTSGTIAFADFRIKPVAGDAWPDLSQVATTETVALVAFVLSGNAGQLQILDGDGARGGDWLTLPETYALNDSAAQNWIRLSYRIDYATQTWDVYVNGQIKAADLGFFDDVAALQQFVVQSDIGNSLDLDALGFSPDNLLFTDADKDGIDDAYETAAGMSTTVNDRNADTDGDGVSNIEEYVLGLSAGLADSDGDTLPDGWELDYGFDPLIVDSSSDSDADGLTAAEEYAAGSEPFVADTDADGLQDGLEVDRGLSPIDADSDSDGFWDGEGLDGLVFVEVWDEVDGDELHFLREDSRYPSLPDQWGYAASLSDLSQSFAGEGRRVRFAWVAPAAGSYWFYIRGEGRTGFWTSRESAPLVPTRGGWSYGVEPQSYEYYFAQRTAKVIYLEAGEKLYFDVFQVADPEGGLSLDLAVQLDLDTAIVPMATSDLQAFKRFANDLDDDFLPDDWETAAGLNPAADGAIAATQGYRGDPDSDGIVNFEEAALGTAPLTVNSGSLQGGLFQEIWLNAGVDGWASFERDARFPSTPDLRRLATDFQSENDYDEQFTSRTRGYIQPAITGDYTFAVAGDGTVDLYLSTDTSKFNKQRIAHIDGFSGENVWNAFPSQQSAPVTLQADQKYYIEMRHFDPSWADYAQVAWSFDGSTFEVIPGSVLWTFDGDPADADDDELLDTWENAHGLSSADPGTTNPLNGPHGDADNDQLSNFYESFAGTDPQVTDSDSDGLSDFLEFYTQTDPLDAQAPTNISALTPWTLTTVGDGVIGEAARYGDTFALAGNGKGLKEHRSTDHFSMLSQALSGSFDLVTQVQHERFADAGVQAGLIVRNGTAEDAAEIALVITPEAETQFYHRESAEENLQCKREFSETEQTSYWLRLSRSGDMVTGYTSLDGQSWIELGSYTVDLGTTLQAGLILASGSAYASGATFTHVRIHGDSDMDGMSDDLEAQLGLDAFAVDSDGDGYSDYEEYYELLSDPTVADLAPAQIVEALDANTVATALLGDWFSTSKGFQPDEARGSFEVTFTLPVDGLYRVAVDALCLYNYSVFANWDIYAKVDGAYVDRLRFPLWDGESTTGTFMLPWLPAGEHTLELFLDNAVYSRNLAFNDITIGSIGGADSDSNGRADWIDARLVRLNGFETAASIVSPACVEGRTRFPLAFEASLNSAALEVTRLPADRWFLSVPLDAENATTVDASFENDGLTSSAAITWTPTNTYTTGTVVIRTGDSLLLAPDDPNKNGNGIKTIKIYAPGASTPASFTMHERDEEPYPFDAPGEWTVTSQHGGSGNGDPEATLIVNVLDGQFSGSPVVVLGQPRTWENPDLPTVAIIESDARMEVQETAADPRTLRMRVDSVEPRYIAARTSADGPVFATATIRSLRIESAANARLQYGEDLGNGLHEVHMDTVITPLPLYDDIELRYEIFVGGVTFDDASLTKVLSAEDFSDLGKVTLTFHMAENLLTSNCHRLLILQDGEPIAQED